MRSLSLVVSLLFAPVLFAQQSQDLVVTFGPFERSADGSTLTALGELRNRTAESINDVDVDLVLNAKLGTLSATHHPSRPADQWSCTNLTPRHVRCRTSIFQGPNQFIPLVVTIGDSREGRFELTAQATWRANDQTLTSARYQQRLYFPRFVDVTNALDAGPGSLRAAIEEANGPCARDLVPCAIRFAFTGPPSIRLLTPLPAITSPDFEIVGDDVELDGSLLTEGHGLEIAGEGPAEVKRLIIGGFPWDGISVTRRDSTFIYACRIGERFDRKTNPNGNRGITVLAPARDVMLSNNLLGSNRRSGIFIAGATKLDLRQNFIDANGASGIFAGPGTSDVTLAENTITNNAHFGIAIARDARGVHLQSTNRIVGNRNLPIDHELDGFSGYANDAGSRRTPAPRLESAAYDAATGTTTIRGTLAVPDPSRTWTVTLYNLDYVWTDLPLSTTIVKDNMFTFSFKGRPATRTQWHAYADVPGSEWSVSELSEPITLD